jgi:hypothetical protein
MKNYNSPIPMPPLRTSKVQRSIQSSKENILHFPEYLHMPMGQRLLLNLVDLASHNWSTLSTPSILNKKLFLI